MDVNENDKQIADLQLLEDLGRNCREYDRQIKDINKQLKQLEEASAELFKKRADLQVMLASSKKAVIKQAVELSE